MIELTVEEIREAIERAGSTWVAEDSALLRSANLSDDLSGMFGLRIEDTKGRLRPASDDVFDAALEIPPPRWDWREQDRVTRVRDQGACGACVSFASCAVIESDHWIRSGNEVSLSPGHLFFCNGGDCDAGWGLAHGLEAARQGVALEADHSWRDDGICNAADPAVKVVGFTAHATDVARRRAVARGPVLVGMRVYRDLFAYSSGVYSHVVGDEVGLHAVCVVGYDDDGGFWIVKNSWGSGFGENGYVRIAYGACGLDSSFDFYAVETAGA